jgi:hypothetical protein
MAGRGQDGEAEMGLRSSLSPLRPPADVARSAPADRPAGFAAGPGRVASISKAARPDFRVGSSQGPPGSQVLDRPGDIPDPPRGLAGVCEVDPPPVDPMDPDPPGRADGRPGPGPDGHVSATGDPGPESPLLPATGSEKKTLTAYAVPIARRLDRRR